MTEPTNAVLAEQVKQIKKELGEFKAQTNAELKDMQESVDRTRRIADEVHYSVRHIKEAVDKMDGMMASFISVVGDQNKKIDQSFSLQNEKIDNFVNSDKRMRHRKELVVSVLQVASGILIALITFWATGKM